MDEYWKRSGQIPTFGNWDYVNELPITQYFENARQAGLIRYSSSSGETDPYMCGEQDLYAVDYKKPVGKETRNRETRMRKQRKVCDVTEYPNKPMNKNKTLHVKAPLPTKLPKPVDEDLYKISPQLVRKTKREYWKRSGEIPTFGNWDYVNELPITQYFENARQAGLIRYSSSSGETDPYMCGEQDLYAVDYKKPVGKETRNRETRMRKQRKVCDVTEYPNKPMNKNKTLHVKAPLPTKLPKPVDEDLYKISPQLVRKTKREYWKRSGEIPTFGNWDYVNELPITQYFENARQAGLIRYSSSSGETDPYMCGEQDLYAVDYKKPVGKETRNRETRMRKQRKVCDVTEYPNKPMNKNKTLDVKAPLPTRLPKPVDEDLYKISPQLVRKTKRKKMLGFISMCLVPAACVS